jgi:hypothetical protein
MAKLVGLILMIVGIYLGLVVYGEGMGSPREESDAREQATAQALDAALGEAAAGASAPAPVTTRVRDRVQGTMDDRARRIAGE